MIILVLNCGSSSLKYQLLDMRSAEDYTLMKKGLVERIGDVVPDHAAGIKLVLDVAKLIYDGDMYLTDE